ncbi:MAG: DUF2141 domain-containing protein [bacterium]|nr:DUF2141 domain-containing protein [bacterium]
MKVILLTLVLASWAMAQTGTTMVVKISGVAADQGQLIVSIWPNEQAWNDKKPLNRDAVPLVNGGGEWRGENLAAGTYAVTVYHDKNSNKKMDRHWYGPPKEKGAASNGAKAQTFGPPKWDDMKFELSGAEQVVEVKFE